MARSRTFFRLCRGSHAANLSRSGRKKRSQRRGGGWNQLPLRELEIEVPEPSVDLLAVNEALDRFQQVEPIAVQLVKLRYFAGLTIPQAAAALGISATTADRYWAYARHGCMQNWPRGTRARPAKNYFVVGRDFVG